MDKDRSFIRSEAQDETTAMADFLHSSEGNKDTSERLQKIEANQKSLTEEGFLKRNILNTQTHDKDNGIRRVIFGEEDKSKPHKTILMVGETGTGKSTLISAMVNYMLGVEYKDRIWCEIIEIKEDQTDSQTKEVIVYDVFVGESPFSLTVIDTPGYGSTEGIETDFKIAETLNELFTTEEGVHEIDLVCLVVSAATTRLKETQLYVFRTILSLFGKDMERNIVLLITHSPKKPINALKAIKVSNVKCAKSGEDPVYFRFDLSHCEAMSEEYANEEEYDEQFRSSWDVFQENMRSFFAFLNQVQTVDVKLTQAVLKKRKQLISCIRNLDDRIKEKEKKKTELEQKKAALEQHEKEKRDDNNFEFEIEEIYKVKVPIEYEWWHWSREATCCTVCEENCHYPGCWWVSSLYWCSIMSEGKCTVCTRKCEYTHHVKENKIYEVKSRKVKKTYEDLKKNYEKEAGEKLSLINRLEDEIKKEEEEKAMLVEECYEHTVALEEIALQTDSVITLQHLDLLIEKMKEIGKSENVEKLEEMKKWRW